MLRYSRQWKYLICKYYTFIKNNTFNTSNASQTDASVSQLMSYLLCAKLSVSLYWCQIVHFLSWCQIVRLPSLCQIMGFYYHSEKFTVPNCPRTIHTPQIVVNYRKFLLWTMNMWNWKKGSSLFWALQTFWKRFKTNKKTQQNKVYTLLKGLETSKTKFISKCCL